MNYKVLAGTVGGKPAGSIITDKDLSPNTNIEALIKGGSIIRKRFFIPRRYKKDRSRETEDRRFRWRGPIIIGSEKNP